MRSSVLVFISLAGLLAACPVPVKGGPSGGGVGIAGKSVPLGGGQKSTEGDTTVVAKVGDSIITVADLQARLDKQSPFVRQRYHAEEKRQEFLDNQLRFELLAQEAIRRGLQEDPDVQETIKKVMVQKLTRLDFEGKVKLSDITEAEMQTYYNEHLPDYNKPEMIRSSVVVVNKKPDAVAAKAIAERAWKSASTEKTLGDRAHFRRLVTEFSSDVETKKAGGDLRYKSREELAEQFGPEVAASVWGLSSINAVASVLENDTAYFVFKKTGTRKPINRGFDQVKNQIRNLLYREKRSVAFNDFVDKLKVDFAVETFPQHLSKLEVKGGPEGTGDGTLLPDSPEGLLGPGRDPHGDH